MKEALFKTIYQKANWTDKLILSFVEGHEHDKLVVSIIKYALKIISPLRERAFVIETVGNYLKTPENIINQLQVAAELIILSAYIKDDIIDNTQIRNNQKTTHINFGIDKALLVSDITLNMANYILINLPVGEKEKKEIINKVNSSYTNLCKGQLSYIEDLKDIFPSKAENTAFLRAGDIIGTFATIPAMISCTNMVDSFYNYGKWLGVSLQLKNDFEDFLPDVDDADCGTFQDIAFKQSNILLAYFSERFSKISEDDKQLFLSYWGQDKDIPNDSKNELYDLFNKYEVYDNAFTHLHDVCTKSIESIKSLRVCEEKSTLLNLVKFAYYIN